MQEDETLSFIGKSVNWNEIVELFERVKNRIIQANEVERGAGSASTAGLVPVSDAALRVESDDEYCDMPENMPMAPTTLMLGAP